MRIIFMGTPDFAVASLEAILSAGWYVAAVVTAPDKPAGRGQKLQETAVKRAAVAHNLPVLQPEKLKDPAFIESLNEYKADLFVVVAFRMLPEAVWAMPPLGTINLHASLLPQYRGAAPINWAVINGDSMTGTTVFFIEREIDTGKVLSFREMPITSDDNAGTLHDKLMTSGAEHLCEALSLIASGKAEPIAQKNIDKLRPAPKIFRETCHIDWTQPAETLHNFIRGLSPYPAAWTTLATAKGEKLTLKLFEAKCHSGVASTPGSIETDGKHYLRIAASNGWIDVKNLQLEGKKRMSCEDFLRGMPQMTECKII